MAHGLSTALDWFYEESAAGPPPVVPDMIICNYGTLPAAAADGTLAYLQDSPNRVWLRAYGRWCPLIDGSFRGEDPGTFASWPTVIGGALGTGFFGTVGATIPNEGLGGAFSMCGALRAFPTIVGASAELVLEGAIDGAVSAALDYVGYGPIVRRASTGRAAGVYLVDWCSQYQVHVGIQYWAASAARTGSAEVVPGNQQERIGGAQVWRVERTTPTVLTFLRSVDGIAWSTVCTVADTVGAEYDQVGFGGVNHSAANGLRVLCRSFG